MYGMYGIGYFIYHRISKVALSYYLRAFPAANLTVLDQATTRWTSCPTLCDMYVRSFPSPAGNNSRDKEYGTYSLLSVVRSVKRSSGRSVLNRIRMRQYEKSKWFSSVLAVLFWLALLWWFRPTRPKCTLETCNEEPGEYVENLCERSILNFCRQMLEIKRNVR